MDAKLLGINDKTFFNHFLLKDTTDKIRISGDGY